METLLETLRDRFPGTLLTEAWGERALFYNPGHRLPHGVYFATIKSKDGANDRASELDRPGLWRLNLGTSKQLFLERFGPPPPRPGKGQVIEGDWDFTTPDRVTPHPVYGWMSWVSVITPSPATLAEIDPMIEAAYARAKASFAKRTR